VDETQQLLLVRWSTLVQVSSLAMVAAFFVLLSRANPRPELRWWARAWTANLIALLFTSIYWTLQVEAIAPVIAIAYVGGKTAFTLMLAQGAWVMIRNGRLFTTQRLAAGIAVFAILTAIFLRDIALIGIVQHSLIGVVMIALAIVLGRSRAEGVTWLTAGVAVRGLLALVEAAAYIVLLRAPASGPFAELLPEIDTFLAASSSIGMGAEWLMVLGSVLAVSERGRYALEASNQRLVLAQHDLRRQADRDPLTGAINRRALGGVFRQIQGSNAMLLFFDLDGFKQINDEHGHPAGDACLQLFATALRESFRPDDHVIRYGGDEFLVIAQGLDSTAAQSRVEDLSARLALYRGRVSCGFSVGMAELTADLQPEAVLQMADENMYEAKNRKRR
jgi:diguanylate cyclase (GGDEF)-like protein